ncbi:MAG: hypothetical protein AB8G23_16080 [Myxococcota bacterium]
MASGEKPGFRAECESCQADLHVCMNCAHWDASAYNECRESSAERVADRDRANRCDYFRPGEGEGRAASSASDALSALEDLFSKD